VGPENYRTLIALHLGSLNGYCFANEILGWNDGQIRDLLVSGQRELSFGELSVASAIGGFESKREKAAVQGF
jgi:hypothetical protein